MKKNNIKVSVIVPVFKVPTNYLKKCIESLINQTLKDIEIILVDDGSPDNCGKICDNYANKDDRVIAIHQKNKGLCAARNTGVKKAKGEWISFVDGDDWLEENAYEILYSTTIPEKIDVVMFGYIRNYKNKCIIMDYNKYFQDNKVYKAKEEIRYIQEQILNYNANCAMVTTKLIRRNFIIENNLFHDEELRQGAEGIEFNIRLLLKAKKIKFVNQKLYHYNYNDNSITTVHNEKNHYMVLNCFKKIKNEIDTNDKILMQRFYDRLNYVIITTAISGYFSNSNPDSYRNKKKKYKEYLKEELVQETFKFGSIERLDLKRKITLLCIKYRLFLIISLLAKLRAKQKK